MAAIEREKVLDVVRQMVAYGQVSQEVAEKYFPEIKKYKDEIVRKKILELIRQHSVNSDRCMMENWVCAHALLQPFKPSNEQMEYLHKYAEQNNYDGAILTSLYNDLKQLKQL